MTPSPRLRHWIGRLLPKADRSWVLEELDDLYAERRKRDGQRSADRWYRGQWVSFATRLIRERGRRSAVTLGDPKFLREVVAVDSTLADFRYALRRLARTPGFTLVAILSLALGIGANTAMFSLVNSVLLREQPYAAPDRTVEIYTSDSDGFAHSTTSFPDLQDLRAREGTFEGVVGTRTFLARLDREGKPEVAFGELVSWDFFQTLGIPMALGRSFVADEGATPGGAPVVILGHHTWMTEYGGDPAILGRTINLNGQAFEVIGVASEKFAGSLPVLFTGYFAPMMMTNELMAGTADQLNRRGSRSMFVKGVLAEGTTIEQATAELEAFSTGLVDLYPESNENRIMTALPAGDVALHPMVDRFLTPVAGLMMAVVGLVLLIACTNLASFLLARAEDRRKEIALRLALGSSRNRLIRQLMVETLTLSALGGIAGVVLAQWCLRLAQSFEPPIPVPVDFVLELDGNVLVFTAVLSLLAGLFFGLAPALQATSPDLAPTLKDEAGGAGKPGRFTLRGSLVVAQVALSFLLLIGAGLFVRSLQKAQEIDPGFDVAGGAVVWPMAELSGYEEAGEIFALNQAIETELLAAPQIDRVIMADRLPLGSEIRTNSFLLPGVPSDASDGTWDIDDTRVMPGYFEGMGIPILRGRAFSRTDLGGDDIAIVSQAFVDRFYPGEDVVGMTLTGNGAEQRIVGVAADTKVRTLGEDPRPYVYELPGTRTASGLQFIVRGEGSPSELLAAALEALDRVDPDLVLFQAKTMDEHLSLMLFPPRMAAILLSVFGALALALSAIGIYGAVSHRVAKRTREMGIRMSLGASSRDVVAMGVGGGMRLVVVGAAIGTVLAAALTWLLARFLFGVSATDMATFVAIPVILLAVALVAAFIPARRAARVDPVKALRAE